MTTAYTDRTLKQAFVHEPLRMVASQPAQVGTSALSMLFTAIFFAAPLLDVTWLWRPLIFIVAGMAALGTEYAFLKGITDHAYVKAHGDAGRWGDVLIGTVWFLMAVSGNTVLLTYAYELAWFVDPPAVFAALLSLAHIIPLSVIAAASAKLHAAADQVSIERRTKDEQEAKARQERDEEEQREHQRKRDERKAEIDAEVYEAEQKALARQRLKASQQTVTTGVTETVSRGVTPRSDAERAALRKQIVTLSQQADLNITAECKRLGISRAMWYKLLKEAEV